MKAINQFKIKFSVLLLVWLVVTAPQWVSAAQINVSVDRNPVSIDESFQIIFTADETPGDDPDFTPLEEDFEILNQSHSSSSSWINGKSSKTIQWTLNVMARQAGSLVIPVIKFGNDFSQSGAVKVIEGTVKKDIDTNEDLYLEVEATPSQPYVQSQVIYTMRLYVRVNIAQASLNDPEMADAVIEKLGEDSKYTTQVSGMDYSVIERRYAIFPQKSGELSIKPLTLTAEVITNTRPSFNGFFNSQVTQTKLVKSKPITLHVKPAPASFTGSHWLSAEQLVLKQEWSGDSQQIKVGEPLTRTLSLLANGTTVGQLPELNTSKTDEHLKSYPDQPVLQEQKKPEGIIAFREEKIALILSKPGSYKLPAIKVPWFNTRTQKMEVAVIPETTITAIGSGASGGQTQSTVVPSIGPAIVKPQPSVTTPLIQAQPDNFWFWTALCLGLGWLATIAYIFYKSQKQQAVVPETVIDDRLVDIEKRLKEACATNNAKAAKEALLNWGRQKFNTSSLGATAAFCDARLRDEILKLSEILYSQTNTQWQGKKLFQVFTEQKAKARIVKKPETGLEPLYRL